MAKPEQTAMNDSGTLAPSDANLTQRRSRPVPCEIVDRDGRVHGPFYSLAEANACVERNWPDQEQDPDGITGWDLRDVGCE
jgi:hypothetical protein